MCQCSSSNNSCVHNQIATFGLIGKQSVTLNIGLSIGCSHNRNNRPSEQSAKCNIGRSSSNSPAISSLRDCLIQLQLPSFSDIGSPTFGLLVTAINYNIILANDSIPIAYAITLIWETFVILSILF